MFALVLALVAAGYVAVALSVYLVRAERRDSDARSRALLMRELRRHGG